MGSTLSPTLDTLPVELIQRIAGFLPCASVLNVILCCRKLRLACNDRLLFKRIAQTSHLGLIALQWGCDALFEDKFPSLIETKAAALAVEKAVDWYTDPTYPRFKHKGPDINVLDFAVDIRRINNWLPQLGALHHPCALQANSAGSLDYLRLFSGAVWPIGYNPIAFAFISSLMEQLIPLGRRYKNEANVPHTSGLTITLKTAIDRLQDMRFVKWYSSNPGYCDAISEFLHIFPYYYSLAVILQYLEHLTLARGTD